MKITLVALNEKLAMVEQFAARMTQDLTRLTALKTLEKLFTAGVTLPIPILKQALENMLSSLLQNARPLRQAALTGLHALIKSESGAALQLGEDVGRVFAAASQFLSDSEKFFHYQVQKPIPKYPRQLVHL